MELSIVTRSTDEHRIIESAHFDKNEAETARQALISQYAGAPRLCVDTEVDTLDVPVWVATRLKGYGCTGEDPELKVLSVGSKNRCIEAATAEVERLNADVLEEPMDGSIDEGWRGVSSEEDAVYIVEITPA